MSLYRILIIAIVILSFKIHLTAQIKKTDSVKYRLKVVDSGSLQTLEYCTVVIYTKENTIRGITSEKGIFGFTIGINDTTIRYRVTRIGYRADSAVFSLEGSNRFIVRLSQVPDTLGNVTVSAYAITRSVDKLSYRVDPRNFKKGTKAINIMRQVPLLTVSADGNLMIKNSAASIYVNGKMASPDIIKMLSADMIKTVEVITNPSSAFSAAGSEGFINIVLQKPKISQYKGNISMVAGLNQHLLFPGADFTISTKKLFLTVNSSFRDNRQNSTSSVQRFDAGHSMVYSNEAATLSAISTKSISSTIYIDLDSTSELSGQLTYNYTRIGSDAKSIDQLANQVYGYDNVTNYLYSGNVYAANIEYKKRLSKLSGVTFDYNVSYANPVTSTDLSIRQLVTSKFINRTQYSDSLQNKLHAVQAIYYNSLFKRKINTELGVSYSFDQNNDGFNNFIYNPTVNSMVINPINTDKLTLKDYNVSTFLLTRFSLAGVGFRTGLRYENLYQKYNSDKVVFTITRTYSNLFPNLVMQKKINSVLNIIANYRRRIKRPDISILSPFVLQYGIADQYIGNPLVNPEYINSYDINFDFQTASTFYEIAPYLKYTKNPIVYLSATSDSLISKKYSNVSSLTVPGISFALKRNFQNSFQLNTSAFIEYYRFSNEFKSSYKYSGINYGGAINISNDFKKLFSAYLTVSYSNKTYDYQSFLQKYADASISIERTFFNDKVLIGAAWNNIFNCGLKSTYEFNDNVISQIRQSRTNASVILISFNYSFGKYFMSTRAQRVINQNEIRKFEK